MKLLSTLLIISAAGTAAAQTPTPAPAYHVARRVTLGGDGGWDYLTADPARQRLFLSRGTHVMVVDTRVDSVVGDIGGTAGVHGVALAPSLGRGFTSNGRDSTVTVFDYTTLAVLQTVHVNGRNPDAITFDSVSGRVFTFNGGSDNASVIDAHTGALVGTVALGGKPETGVVDGRGHLYVNVETKNEIVALDTRTLAVLGHWALAGCEEPTGLAFDVVTRRLFSGCGGNRTLVVVNADNGRVVATLPVGEGVDAAAFDPSSRLVFASAGEGNVTVIHEDAPDSYRVVQTVATARGARTMTVDPATHRAYTVTAEFGTPPAATAERPRPRAPMVPGSFALLELQP
jgi:DNA-binding beta-propeller fold protein YncE